MTLAERASQDYGLIMWPKLKLILDLIDLGCSKLLIRSCNGAGKTFLLSTIIVDETKRHDDIQTVVTGASASALKETLWRNIKRTAKHAKLDTSNFRIDGWDLSPLQRVIPLAPSRLETGQGFHAPRVDVIVDEATKMSSSMLTALFSNVAGSGLKILTYNPINPHAAVFDLEEQAIQIETLQDEDGLLIEDQVRAIAQGSSWLSIGISAFEHPNVIEGWQVIPGAVTRSMVEDFLRIDSIECPTNYPDAIILPWSGKAYIPTAEALARVCGQWSQIQTSGFIAGSVVVAAWKVVPTTGLRIAGADIGAGDDPSVWTHFVGNAQMPFEQLRTADTGVTAEALNTYCENNDIDVLGIDDTGVGRGVTDRLQERKPKYRIIPINFASRPVGFEEVAIRKPANARCEMYLILEKQMRSMQIRVLYDKELQRELCCQKIQASKTKADTLRIEDKSLIKKRLGNSPNKADATALARYAARMLEYYNRPPFY